MWALFLIACSTPAPAPAPAPRADATAAADLANPGGDPAKKLPKVRSSNRPPRVASITFDPAQPNGDDDLRVVVETTDADEQYVGVRYKWSVNGEEVLGAISDELRATNFAPGDRVRVDVTADDGEATAASSSEVLIQNRAPTILTEARELTRMSGFQLRCKDPDGGEVKWSMSGGPQGLTLSEAGMLDYRGDEAEPGGTYTVQLRCEDEAGGWARLDVPITVSPGSKAPKPQ